MFNLISSGGWRDVRFGALNSPILSVLLSAPIIVKEIKDFSRSMSQIKVWRRVIWWCYLGPAAQQRHLYDDCGDSHEDDDDHERRMSLKINVKHSSSLEELTDVVNTLYFKLKILFGLFYLICSYLSMDFTWIVIFWFHFYFYRTPTKLRGR